MSAVNSTLNLLTQARALPCDRYQPAACAMVIFGASGDLAARKLIPAVYKLDVDGLLTDPFQIVGFGRSKLGTAQFRDQMRQALQEFGNKALLDDQRINRFCDRLHYVQGDYGDAEALRRLQTFLAGLCTQDNRHVFYMAVPASVSEAILRSMKDAGLGQGSQDRFWPKIVMEKPFGLDLEGAQRLNQLLSQVFAEPQIYRVDHYLAKSTVQNLIVFRFGNAIWEPLWNNHYVDHVQITAAESIGVEGRGGYYEESGIVRDMVQNHVLQVLSLVAMEPPVPNDLESIHDKKLEIFKSLEPLLPEDFVFGQYDGYRREPKVAAGSATPTFVALRLQINNWRWRGVPFYVRAGKALARKVTEVAIQFKSVPLCVLSGGACRNVSPNILLMRIQPDEGIRLSFVVKTPERSEEVTTASLDFRYSQFNESIPDAYERIILDSLCGNCTCGRQNRLWRADAIEAAWKAVTPLLQAPKNDWATRFPNYAPGSWGPKEADVLIRRDNRRWIVSE
jgi:glucose-6-phosphate 1-dehydrogenase